MYGHELRFGLLTILRTPPHETFSGSFDSLWAGLRGTQADDINRALLSSQMLRRSKPVELHKTRRVGVRTT
jgi:hypothetical protein